ncbi:MAG: leucine-rich repeat protein [Atopobiaceae bacterium]|nr:leucine-rich repeat protein [Atopobiaceae bacterium]
MSEPKRPPIAIIVIALLAQLVLSLSGCGIRGDINPSVEDDLQDAATDDFNPEEENPLRAMKLPSSDERMRAYGTALTTRGIVSVSEEESTLAPLGPSSSETNAPTPSTRYTVLIYMVGSNLESNYAAASDDLSEILDAGLDYRKVNVVVCAGGARRWNVDIPSNRTSVLDLSKPEGERIVAQTASSVSMGSGQMLASFLEYAEQHYPAQHTALVFWDHGGGPLWGFGNDENHDGDGLLLSEVGWAMEHSPYTQESEKRLDWVGFDTCLMGSLENAMVWSPYADWLVASEEVEPQKGWDYSFLTKACESVDPKDICSAILEACELSYTESTSTLASPQFTLSALDLSKLTEVTSALDELAQELLVDVEQGAYANLSRLRRNAKAFGLLESETRAMAYDIIDVGDLAQEMSARHAESCDRLAQAVNQLVWRQVGNVERAHGVSVYFPGENRELYEVFSADGNVPANDLSPSYGAFVHAYADHWRSLSEVDWTIPPPSVSKDGICVQLNEEQVAALTSATYTVMQERDGGYAILTSDMEAPIDEQGRVLVPSDPPIIVSKTGTSDSVPAFFRQVESADGKQTYVSKCFFLNPAGDYLDYNFHGMEQQAIVTLAVTPQDDSNGKTSAEGPVTEASIISIALSEDSIGAASKTLLDTTRFSTITQYGYCGGLTAPTYDATKSILPCSQWDNPGVIAYHVLTLDEGLSFFAEPVSNYCDACTIQVTLTDANGNQHALEPMHLEQASASHVTSEQTLPTDHGILTCTVSRGEACITNYEGEDQTLALPAEVGGYPITSIGERAFELCSTIEEVVVPRSVKQIGPGAFNLSGVRRITLPATVTIANATPFKGASKLEAFELGMGDGKASTISVNDGVLFSASGETLLAYPNAHGTRYEVPKATKNLGYGAFAGTDVEAVSMPEGLRNIGAAAFFACRNLTEITLPQSLEYIGPVAYGTGDYQLYTDNLSHVESIHLGPNVSYVGDQAFCGVSTELIDVDPANTHYKGKGGCLLNAAGDNVVAVARKENTIITVPEGVVSLSPYAFANYSLQTEFVLPDSVSSIDETSLPLSYRTDERGQSRRRFECTIHATKGSYAERFAKDRGIAYDNVTDLDSLKHEDKTLERDGLRLTFRVYADHASLMAVEAADPAKESSMTNAERLSGGTNPDDATVLRVPAEVFGVPVTTVSLSDAYTDAAGESHRMLNHEISSIALPASIAELSADDLEALPLLQSIEVDPKSEELMTVDGVLFSHEGTQLIAYPKARRGEYSVPEGVRTIEAGAFANVRHLCAVTMPDSVRKLGTSAFESCESLERVSFGEGLSYVGERCFSGCSSLRITAPLPSGISTIGNKGFDGIAACELDELPDALQVLGDYAFRESKGGNLSIDADASRVREPHTLKLGPALKSVGSHALDGFAIDSFAVDNANQTYVANGPFLLSKDGTKIVVFAKDFVGIAAIPEGVRDVHLDAFACAHSITDVVVPPSVLLIDLPYGATEEEPYASMRFHVEPDSYAERILMQNGLTCVVE